MSDMSDSSLDLPQSGRSESVNPDGSRPAHDSQQLDAKESWA